MQYSMGFPGPAAAHLCGPAEPGLMQTVLSVKLTGRRLWIKISWVAKGLDEML